MSPKTYDVVIVGGGPGGLTAALYASRSKLSTLIIEKGQVGGQAATTEEIENWPGIEQTSGSLLMQQMADHAKKFGAEFVADDVIGLESSGFLKTVKGKKSEYLTKTVILSTGAEPRILGIPGELEFRGKGVSYCATCDADFYEELDVVVLGNGDAAIEEAMYLTKFAETVTIIVIHEEGKVDATPIVAERAFKNDKIKWIWNSTIAEIAGDGLVEKVVIKNIITNETRELETNGVFSFVGTVPRTKFLKGIIDLDDRGYVLADHVTMATNMDGVYAVGDCREKYLRQVVTAAGDGATAAVVAEKYIYEEEHFINEVLSVKEPVVVAFWSPNNEDSMAKMPAIEDGMQVVGASTKLVKIDTYREQRLASRYNITTIPTLLIFSQGEVKASLEGEAVTAEALVATVQSI